MKQHLQILAIVFFCIFIPVVNLYAQWKEIKSLHGQMITCFAATSTKIFAGTDSNRIFSSSDNGNTWFVTFPGIIDWGYVTMTSFKDTIVQVSKNGTVFVSKNNGEIWDYVGIFKPYINSLAFNGSDLFAGTREGVFRSRDFGASWDTILKGFDISAFAFSPSTLIAGNLLSIDNGLSWVVFGCNEKIYSLLYKEPDIFAGTFSGICISHNNGMNWMGSYGGFSGLPDNGTLRSFIHVDTNIFVANDRGGVFLSTNNGGIWTNFNNDTNKGWAVSSLLVKNGKIFAGTPTGVWVRNFPAIPDTSSDNALKDSLFWYAPNPTTGNITFHNVSDNLASISILNVLGQKVMELSNPHSSSITIDISKFPAGIYYVRLNSFDIRKIIKE